MCGRTYCAVAPIERYQAIKTSARHRTAPHPVHRAEPWVSGVQGICPMGSTAHAARLSPVLASPSRPVHVPSLQRVGWGEERTPTLRRARYVGVPSSPQPTSSGRRPRWYGNPTKNKTFVDGDGETIAHERRPVAGIGTPKVWPLSYTTRGVLPRRVLWPGCSRPPRQLAGPGNGGCLTAFDAGVERNVRSHCKLAGSRVDSSRTSILASASSSAGPIRIVRAP